MMREVIQEVTTYVNTDFQLRQVRHQPVYVGSYMKFNRDSNNKLTF